MVNSVIKEQFSFCRAPTVAITGLAVVVLSAKSVVRRMESGRNPERAVRMRRATPVSTGWYTDLLK